MKHLTKPEKAPPRALRARKVHQSAPTQHDARNLRAIRLGDGLPPIPKMMEEIADMTDVLMGRVEPPVHQGVITLMETADAYFARASEMTMLIQQGEREGTVLRGSAAYRFRTGELRTFMELAKRAADLGSRRITVEQMKAEAARYGRQSRAGF